MSNKKIGTEYEIKIYNYLAKKYPDLEIFHNRKLKGNRSGIERQVDILIRKGNIDFNDDTIIECKYYKKNIDVKVVDSFHGMLQDIGINHGILIVKTGASKGATNRANYDDILIDVISFDEEYDLFKSLDECFDYNIRNLMYTEAEFYKRIKQNSAYADIEKSSYNDQIIYFKKGYANTDYYARKKLISSSLRHFRDFPDNQKITIKLDADYESSIYELEISQMDLIELFVTDFQLLKSDIEKWRQFIGDTKYTKDDVYTITNRLIEKNKLKVEKY